MIKSYLQLVRFPGIFTAFSNIFLGFLISQPSSDDWLILPYLLTITAFLYSAGMILNDYFDFRIDKNERANRPLPSGTISRKNALFLGIIFLSAANTLSFFVNPFTSVIVLLMTGLIIFYDKKSKNIPIIGILNLSFIRFLNVILGTIAIFNYDILIIAIPIAIFVSGISILAKYETSILTKKMSLVNFLFVATTVIFVLLLTLKEGFFHYAILSIFIFVSLMPYFIHKESKNKIQKIVSTQLLSIIILDAVLISAFSESFFIFISVILYISSLISVKKIYVT